MLDGPEMAVFCGSMKTTIRCACAVLLLSLCQSALAIHSFKDQFSKAAINSKWEPVDDGGGAVVAGGVVHYIASSASGGGGLLLKTPQPSVAENWEAIVTINNTAPTTKYSWVGIAVGKPSDPFAYNASIEIETDFNQCFLRHYHTTPAKEKIGAEMSAPARKLIVRIRYNAAKRLLTFSYRPNTTADWKTLSTFSPFNDTNVKNRANWKLNPATGKFSVAVFAGTEDYRLIKKGVLTADDFVIRNY